MSEHQPHASPYASPSHAASPGPTAISLEPLDLQSALEQNARMQKAGTALQRQVAALEAEKAALQAAVASARAPAPTAGSHGRPKGPVPPEFHGTKIGGYEVDAWIRDMKVQFSFYGAREFPDDAAKVRHAAMFLKGRAAEWWESEDKSSGVEASWDAFVERLHHRYRPMQAAVVARERLDRLKQKGTVSAYADLFQKELTPIKDMSASDQIFFFVKGLSSMAVANKVREKSPATLHEAMDVAVRAEAFLGGGRASHSSYGSRMAFASGSSGSSSTSAPMDINAIDEEDRASEDAADPAAVLMAKVEAMVEHRLAAMFQQKKFGSQGASGSGSGSAKMGLVPGLKAADLEKLRAEGRCFRCKEKGHMKRECPFP
jgi:hypothetical protein